MMGDVRRAGFVNVAKCVEEGAGEDEQILGSEKLSSGRCGYADLL